MMDSPPNNQEDRDSADASSLDRYFMNDQAPCLMWHGQQEMNVSDLDCRRHAVVYYRPQPKKFHGRTNEA